MPKNAIPEPDIYLGGADIDRLEVPEYDTEWSDYGNALQVGLAQMAGAGHRLAEYATDAEMAKSGARYWEQVAEEQRAQYSPGARVSLAKEFATTGENAAWKDLSAILLHGTESLPVMAATMTPIGVAVRAGITSKAALAGIGALSEGTVGAGYIASDIAQEIEGLSPKQLGDIPGVSSLRDMGWSDERIKDSLKQQQQAVAVPVGGAITALTGAIAGPLEATLFKPTTGLLPRVARGAAIEAPQEAIQEFSENAAVNYAMGRDVTEGGLEAALAGAFVGGPAGGVTAGVLGGKTRRQRVIEEGYKDIYKTGDENQINTYRELVISSMGEEEATKFFETTEADADKELEHARRSKIDIDQEEALKAHEPEPAPTAAPAVEEPSVDVDEALASAAAAEEAAAVPTPEEARQEIIDQEFAADESVQTLAPEAPVAAPTKAFTGTGLEHFDTAFDTTVADVSKDASVGKPLTTPKGKPSTRPIRYPKERAVALAGLVDDVQESLATLKAEGYDTAPIENVIQAFAKNPKGKKPGESIISWFAGRSGGRGYESPYKKQVTVKKGVKQVKKLTGHNAIDQFLNDLQTARSEVEAAGPQEIITAPTVEKEVKREAAKKVSKRKPKREGKPEPTKPAEPKPISEAKPESKPKPKAAEKAKAVSKQKDQIKERLQSKNAADNLWKIAQGSTVTNVPNMRKATGVKDLAPERIKELLNTAVDKVLGKEVTEELNADEKKALDKLVKFVKDTSKIGFDKQLRELPRPEELVTEEGKARRGKAAQLRKFKIIAGEAPAVLNEVSGDITESDLNKLQDLISDATTDPEAEQELVTYMSAIGISPDDSVTVMDAIQSGRVELQQSDNVAEVIKVDRIGVVSQVADEATGIDKNDLNSLVDTLINLPVDTRFETQQSIVRALVSQYGVSQETANNFSMMVNDLVGTEGIERTTSTFERMREANATGDIDEAYTTFNKRLASALRGWGIETQIDATVENYEVFERRAHAGMMMAQLIESMGTDKHAPMALVNTIVLDMLHKNDPVRTVIERVHKLGYGDLSVTGTEKKVAGSFIQGRDNEGILRRVVTMSTDIANRITGGDQDAALFMIDTYAHELVHVATNNAIDHDPKVREQVQEMLDAAREAFTEQNIDGVYGLYSVHEFVAEGFSNPDFIADLNRIPAVKSPAKNLWFQFIDLVKSVLGIKVERDTLMHQLVAMSDELFMDRYEADRVADEAEFASRRGEKKVIREAGRKIDELLQMERAKGEPEVAMEEDFYGPEMTVEQQIAELERIYDKGEPNLIIKAPIRPKDLKYKKRLNARADNFTSKAGGVLIDLMGNEGQKKYDDIRTWFSAATDKSRSFGLGMMMLDQIETTYKKLFDNLMPTGDKALNLIQAASYRDLKNPLHVLIRAWQNRQAAAKRFEAANDKLLSDIEKLERGDRTSADMQTMYDVAHNATLAEIHPELPWNHPKNKGFHHKKRSAGVAEKVHATEHAKYKALHPDVKKMYGRMRDFYERTQLQARTKLLASITHRYGLTSTAKMSDGIMLGDARTHKQIDALEFSDNVSEKEAADIRTALKAINGRTLPNGPYFPLMRYGDYVVEGRKRTNVKFTRADYTSKAAMDKAIKAAKDRYKAEHQGTKIENVKTLKNGDVSFDYFEYVFSTEENKIAGRQRIKELEDMGYEVGPLRIKGDESFGNLEFATQILAIAEKKLKGGTEHKEAARMALREAMITLLPDTAAQKRLLKRTGVAGASKDMGRGLANYMKSAGWSLANLDYISDISDVTHVINEADRYVSDDSAITVKQVAIELQRRAANPNQPGKVTEWASKLGFFNYLFSVSYSVVNSTQPLLVALPWLSGQHGTRKATAALGDAYKKVAGRIAKEAWATGFGAKAFTPEGVDANQIVTNIRNMLADKGDQKLADMIGELQAEDIIGATFTLEIAEAAKGRGRHGKLSKVFQKTMEFGRTMPHIVEILNRTTSAIAAYELAVADGKSERDAREHARLAVRKTQFDYSELNRPRYFVKNDLLRAMTMFKIHPLGIYGLLIGNVKTLMSSDATKAEGRAAGKALAMLLATHGAFAGLAGSVLLEPIKVAMGLLAHLFDDDDEMREWLSEPEVAMRQMLFEATGNRMLGEAAVFGLPRLIGVDMHTRLGIQNLMLMHSNEGDTSFERGVNTVTDSLLGPILGMEGGFTRMAAAIANGQGWAKASEYAMPKGIRDIQRSFRYSQEGMTDFNGNRIQDSEKFNAKDLAVRALGFAPSIEAETHLGRGFKQRHEGRLKRKARGLINRWKNADAAERRELWKGEIQDFNDSLSAEDRKLYRISRGKLQRSLAARKRREREIYKGTHFRRQERAMKKEVEFLNI